MYDIILQNNASKEFHLFNQLENVSLTNLYMEFDNIDLDELPAGEYTIVCLFNDRDDIEYEYKTPILQTILHTSEGDIVLKDLYPFIGLLRIGDVQDVNTYNINNNTFIYYDGK